MSFLLETLRLGLSNLLLHKLRSLLTALGIIIGVAAVVAITAYGEGAKRAALADILQLGANNIILRSVKPPAARTVSDNQRMQRYGITRLDLRRIESNVQGIQRIVPLKRVGDQVLRGVRTVPAEVYGTLPSLKDAASLRVGRGRYLAEADLDPPLNVAVLGASVAEALFPLTDPLGSRFRVDNEPFTVVGVLAPVGLAGGAGSALVGRDLNYDIHIPLSAAESRFGDQRSSTSGGSMEISEVELSEVILQAPDTDAVEAIAGRAMRVLDLAHAGQNDVTAIVPMELIAQAERTAALFQWLMVVIAGLSLLVGGIGIMNIMLASVTERTREVGIRRALGATRLHIIAQFLVETTLLSCAGGLIGVGLGVGWCLVAHPVLVPLLASFSSAGGEALKPPIVTVFPVAVAFVVAALVGIVFGLYPAAKAAQQDPIVALRHD